MRLLRYGYVAAPLIGAVWMPIVATTTAIAASFITGDAYRPALIPSLIWGALLGGVIAAINVTNVILVIMTVFLAAVTLSGLDRW